MHNIIISLGSKKYLKPLMNLFQCHSLFDDLWCLLTDIQAFLFGVQKI